MEISVWFLVKFLAEFALSVLSAVPSFISAVLGVLVGNLLWVLIRKPRLKVEVANITTQPVPGQYRTFYRTFYNMGVINKCCLRRFCDPARNVRLRISWQCIEGECKGSGREGGSAPGKWSFRPEPIRYEISDGVPKLVPELSLIPQCEIMDIFPGAMEPFSLIVKYEGEKVAYVFSGYSYLARDFKREDYMLKPGKYSFEISLIGENAYRVERFYVEIPGNEYVGPCDVKVGKQYDQLDCFRAND